MNIDKWCKVDEAISIAFNDETFRQYAGLNYDERVLKRLTSMVMRNAEIFIKLFREPRLLYLSAIETIADAKSKHLELKLHRIRTEKISDRNYKFNNEPVNWNTWRQFNSMEENPLVRKYIFDEFIEKTRFIAPIIEKRFDIIRKVYSSTGEYQERSNVGVTGHLLSPLSGYLESEGITLSKLKNLITQMGRQAIKPFSEAILFCSKIIGRSPDYFDDFYFFRNRIFRDLEKPFIKTDAINSVKRSLKVMGFDLSGITFDTEDRTKKYPSPICFFVKIPDDIRVLYKSESPYFDLQGCYHETGHAIHAASINRNLSYVDRYKFPMGIAEIFSIFLERLTRNLLYLESVLGIRDKKILEDLTKRNKFMELFFVTFYAANSLMKLEYWTENLTIEQANKVYEHLMRKYTGFEMPGRYWMLHHILPEAIMYVPSYLIAAVRAAELEKYLQDKFSEKWWEDRLASSTLKEFMSKGAGIEIGQFSKLDWNIFMKEIIDL